MSDPAFRLEPMTVGMVLDRSLKLYAKNILLIFSIVIIPILLGLPFSAFFILGLEKIQELPPATLIAILIGFLFFFLIYIIVFVLSQGALTYAISQLFLGRHVDIKESYRFAARRLWTLIGANIAVGLLIFLGLLLCLAPGVYLWVGFALLTPVVILEKGDMNQCFSRAWELSKDCRLEIFAVLIVFAAFSFVLQMGIGVLNGILGLEHPQLALIAGLALPFLSNVVLTPLPPLAKILLYYNARIKKEGFDLDLLAQSLGHGSFEPEPLEPDREWRRINQDDSEGP